MKILLLDNYDSFTYNLVHLVKKIGIGTVEVFYNDKLELDEVTRFDKIILSPGPGIPSEAGLLLPLIREYAAAKPMLGVCLGHQAIGEAFGGSLINLSTVFHGVAMNVNTAGNDITLDGIEASLLFSGLPRTFPVGRYHSWIVNESDLPAALQVTARDDNGYIMALQHRNYDIQGVQFHPESVLTPDGETILRNWLKA